MAKLEEVIKKLNKKYGEEIIRKGTTFVNFPKLPFSSPRANYMTYGGIPVGKATEFMGEENGGKTTTALDIVAQFQRHEAETGGSRRAVYVDAENTLDEEWAEKIGVNLEELILIRPFDQTGEEVLQMMLDLIDTGEIGVMVLDSLPMLVPQGLYDKEMDKKSYGGISGAMSEFSRRVSPRLAKHKTTLIIINQMRTDMNNPFNVYHTPGGKALKHLYALRLYFRRGSFIDKENNELTNKAEDPAGNLVDIRLVKTKVCKPDRRVGQYTLNYSDGVDVIGDTIFMAIKFGVIVQAGAWFTVNGGNGEPMVAADGSPLKFQGKPKLIEFLRENPEVFEEVKIQVDKKIRGGE